MMTYRIGGFSILSARLSVFPSVHPSVHQSVHMSVHPSVHWSVHPIVRLSVCWSLPLGYPARHEAQPTRREAKPARLEAWGLAGCPGFRPCCLGLKPSCLGLRPGCLCLRPGWTENLSILQDFVPYGAAAQKRRNRKLVNLVAHSLLVFDPTANGGKVKEQGRIKNSISRIWVGRGS